MLGRVSAGETSPLGAQLGSVFAVMLETSWGSRSSGPLCFLQVTLHGRYGELEVRDGILAGCVVVCGQFALQPSDSLPQRRRRKLT